MNLAGQEGARGDHHIVGHKAQTELGNHAAHLILLDQQVVDRRLKQGEIGLGFDRAPNRRAVQGAIGLATGSAHRRALTGIQGTPLDTGTIGSPRHDPAQGIDFPHQMPFAYATDGWIAAHRADRFDVMA